MKKKEIILTVAIPTYNRAKNLDFALKNLLAQKDDRIEILISDNCSTDTTEEVVARYKKHNPEIMYIKNEENLGAALNYVECYTHARGKFIYLLADDDVLLSGAIVHILNFLEKNNDISLLYLNHVFFRDVFEGIEKCTKPYLDIDDNIITKDKTLFMNLAKMRITFTPSLIISKEKYLMVDNPEQYKETRFLQTCVALMCTKEDESKMGVLKFPCVAANLPSNNTAYNGIRIFGINAKNVLCGIGAKAGYKKSEMDKIYKNYVLAADVKAIANAKISGSKTLKKDFKECVWPAVKDYFGIRIILKICMMIPTFIWRPIKNVFSKSKYGR